MCDVVVSCLKEQGKNTEEIQKSRSENSNRNSVMVTAKLI